MPCLRCYISIGITANPFTKRVGQIDIHLVAVASMVGGIVHLIVSFGPRGFPHKNWETSLSSIADSVWATW